MKGLQIGGGPFIIPGYINIDRRRGPGVTMVDIRNGLPFEDYSFDVVYSSHCLEHFYWYELKGTILPEMLRVLKEGGILRLAVPDVTKTIEMYKGHTFLLPGVLYGGGTWAKDKVDHDLHHFGWDAQTFLAMFRALNLLDVREWKSEEYQELEGIDDAAGVCPITVNVEGKKPIGWTWEKVSGNLL